MFYVIIKLYYERRNERRKIENRKSFTEEVKDYIRYKSDGRCSHCGKVLKDDFTVEHVIPLNKGGSNYFHSLDENIKKGELSVQNGIKLFRVRDFYCSSKCMDLVELRKTATIIEADRQGFT